MKETIAYVSIFILHSIIVQIFYIKLSIYTRKSTFETGFNDDLKLVFLSRIR